MRTMQTRTAAPSGPRGGERFSASRLGIPDATHRTRGRGAVAWAVALGVLAASAVAFGSPVSTSYIYGIDDSSQLWVMGLSGTSAGTSQLLFTTQITGSQANGLAYDSVGEQLFVADEATSNLYWWKQGATNLTLLGSISAYTGGSVGQPQSAAYYDNAYWFFGGGSQGNQLTKLSLDYSGVVPTIASGTTFVIGGMSADPSGGGDMVITPLGTLFAYSRPVIGNFFTADLTNIVSGTVDGYQLKSTTVGTGLQLALGTDNTTLYGHDFSTGNWYTVDTSNGTTTQVLGFTTAGFRDLGGASIQAVPEPSTLVLAGLGGGIVAWHVSRRRRKSRRQDDAAHAADLPITVLT